MGSEATGPANPFKTADDPTAQTMPLTVGQQIAAEWEAGKMTEAWELAAAIDESLGMAWGMGLSARPTRTPASIAESVGRAEEVEGV